MSTENYAKMMQFDGGIKKIKPLGKQLWPKQIKANFPLLLLFLFPKVIL